MRTRDRALLLDRALRSVGAQSFGDWRLVVVNDGGDAAVVDAVVARHTTALAGRVHVRHHPASLGMEAAHNAGINATRSEFIAIHDDDDRWHPDFLARTVGFLDDHRHLPGLEGVATRIVRISERIDGDRVTELGREWFNQWLSRATLAEFCGSNPLLPIGVLYRRRVLDAIGLFRTDLTVLSDWEFYLRLLRRFDLHVIQDGLAFYHVRPDASGADANSVRLRLDELRLHESRLRNQLLREDLDAGRVGLGVLMNLAIPLERVAEQTRVTGLAVERLRKLPVIRGLIRRLGLAQDVPRD
jgi:glycosyltransferase involved in cell wall biosynthesis